MSDDFPPLIGKYKVTGIIAKGGMGIVYKAIHPSLKRYVVIKKMTARNQSGNAERFKKEAQILLDLQSPYIVHLFDYFTEAGYRYMVEELVDGIALDKLIKKQTALPCSVAMLIMQDACYALRYAHSKEIVHRDIKPGNLLISKRGEIKLADFGIASDSAGDNVTETGVALGTPAYMPPEQFEDSSSVDARADIYALGIMLYEMLTGTKPYPTEFSIDTLKTIKKGTYINPRKLDKSIPKPVCRLIHKMIRPKAKNRYQSINAVLKQVKKYLNHYDTHELRVQVAKSVVTQKTYTFPKIEAKDKIKIRVRRIILSVLAFLLLLAACWKLGFIHQAILRKWYSPVTIEMRMPRALSNSTDLPVRAFFFENDKDKIPEVRGGDRTLFVQGSRLVDKLLGYFSFKGKLEVNHPSEKNKTYVMRKLYLKQGNYRVKVVVGPYVWWKSFTVSSDDCLISCDFLKNMVRNIKIKSYAYDAASGKDISEKATFQIMYNNKWISLDEMDLEALKSATVWKIKITAEGYQEEIFSLLIDWYQDEIFISAELKKE
ncbi:MAG: serine/threonine protein kinase [Treponema sp.]|nr:serine/threonine protein kinase [Treponema sp.]